VYIKTEETGVFKTSPDMYILPTNNSFLTLIKRYDEFYVKEEYRRHFGYKIGFLWLFFIFFLRIVLGAEVGFSSVGAHQEKKHIKTAIIINYYPYTFINKQGAPDGFIVDLMKATGKVAEMEMEIKVDVGEKDIKMLETGEIDFLPIEYSAERDKKIDFTEPFMYVYDAIFTRINSPKINALEDIKGKAIIVIKEDQAYNHLSSTGFIAQEHLILARSPLEALKMLSSGKGDAAFIPRLIGLMEIENLNLKNISRTPVNIESFYRMFCLGVKEGNLVLLEQLNEGLSIIKKTGLFREIYVKWFGRLEPKEITLKSVLMYILIVLAALLTIGVILVIWSFLIRKQVALRTRKLEQEVIEQKNTEMLFRQVTENIREVFWIGTVDWSIIHYISPAYEKVWGRQCEELYHNPYSWVEAIIEEDREKIVNAIPKEISKDTKEIVFEDYRVKRPDGSISWISARAFPVLDDNGKPYRIAGIAEDITDRKQIEEDLKRSRDNYRSNLDNMMEGCQIIGYDWRYIYVNDTVCNHAQLERNKLIGRTMMEVFPGIDRTDMFKTLKECMEERVSAILENEFLYQDNTKRWFVLSIQPSIEGLFILSIDITERKLVEKSLQRINRELQAISQCNEALLRATDEQSLLDEICRIINIEAGYPLVMVAYTEYTDLLTLRPVAWAGIGNEFMESIRTLWADRVNFECSPAGRATRTGSIIYIQDFSSDPEVAHLREVALKLEYNSEIALPLKDENAEVFGVLIIFSSMVNAFVPDEIRLMEELSNNLGFGISTLRLRALRDKVVDNLKIMEEKYRLVADNTYDWEFWLLPDGNLSYMSPSCLRITGYTTQEFISNPDLLHQIVYEDDREMVRTHIKGSLSEDQMVHIIDYRIIRKDGEMRWINHFCVPVFGVDGKWMGKRGSNRDITERKKTETALKESEAKLRSILDNVEIGVILINSKMQVLEMNSRMRKWFPSIEPEKHPICYHVLTEPPLERCCENCPIEKTLIDGLSHEVTIPLMKDGVRRIFRTVSSPVFTETGEIVSVIETIEDITEKISLESQLKQAQKMEIVARLAGGVAHDFNNMLSVIIGRADLALANIDLKKPVQPALLEIRKAAERSANLTRQLLAFSRKQTAVLKILNLNETIEGMLIMLRRLIGEDINLEFVPSSEICYVKMDPSQVDQVLANLCVNARDAIDGVGKIVITVNSTEFDEYYCSLHTEFVPGKYAMLSVSDNGCGMDKVTLSKVFDPFFTTKEVGRGTGLGLATIHGIIRQNNGFINVYSEPGHGTIFRIYIPLHLSDIENQKSKISHQQVIRGHETILIVEDERSILEMGTLMLEDLGYHTLQASSPAEAIRIAEKNPGLIQLLLTDVVMPEMNGKELSEKIKKYCPGINCLFMSGYTNEIIAHQGVLEEGVFFIEKPFSMYEMAAKVRQALTGDHLN